jgi:hypothetical protein
MNLREITSIISKCNVKRIIRSPLLPAQILPRSGKTAPKIDALVHV